MLIKLMMDPPKDFDITLFTYPIPSYFGNALPLHYIQLIKDEKGVSELMDLGSLMGKLMTAQYRERTGYGEFFQDFDRVAGNCMRFHRNSPSPDAAGYVAMGGKLKGYCKSYKVRSERRACCDQHEHRLLHPTHTLARAHQIDV